MTFYTDEWLTIYGGDCREVLPTLAGESVNAVVTSPPYWMLRDYGHPLQLGMEDTPQQYVEEMVATFRLVRRVMHPGATLWLNLGDTFAASGKGGGGNRGDRKAWRSIAGRNGWRSPPAGYKPKDLTLVPFQLVMAMREDGWYLRQVIVWRKPAAVEPLRLDRPATSHEYVYLLTKSEHYAARNPGLPWWGHSVWDITSDADASHQALMPTELARRCILAGTKAGDVVLDPFSGSGTVARAAQQLSRRSILIDLNPELAGAAQTPLGLEASA